MFPNEPGACPSAGREPRHGPACATRLGTYEDVGWARWLPGGHRLIVGAEVGSYAVDAETLSVRAFSFGPGNDINFSATVLPVP